MTEEECGFPSGFPEAPFPVALCDCVNKLSLLQHQHQQSPALESAHSYDINYFGFLLIKLKNIQPLMESMRLCKIL